MKPSVKYPPLIQTALPLLGILIILFGCRDISCSAELEKIEKIINTYPDSALIMLQSMESEPFDSDRDRALYSILYSQALDKNYIDVKSDSIIRRAIDYYSEERDDRRMAQALYYSGVVELNRDSTIRALDNFLKASDLASTTSDNYLKGQINSVLAKIYFDHSLYVEALALYKESAESFRKAGHNIKYANGLSYIGKIYTLTGENLAAADYYIKANSIYSELLDKGEDKVLHRLTANTLSIADIYIDKEDYDKAEMLIREFRHKYHCDTVPTMAWPLYGRMSYLTGKLEESEMYLRRALVRDEVLTESAKCGVYYMLSELYRRRGNLNESLEYRNSYFQLKEALKAKYEEKRLLEANHVYEKRILAESYAGLEKRYKVHLSGLAILFLFTGALFAVLIIAIMQYNRNLVRRKGEEIESLKNFNRELAANLQTLEERYIASRSLESQNERKSDIFKAYDRRITHLRRLMEISCETKNDPDLFYKEFKNIMMEQIDGESAFADLRFLANVKYGGFIERLSQKYPKLNTFDLDYCALIALGFSSRSLRVILGHTNSYSLYNRTSRIKSKLGITGQRLENYIKEAKEESIGAMEGHFSN